MNKRLIYLYKYKHYIYFIEFHWIPWLLVRVQEWEEETTLVVALETEKFVEQNVKRSICWSSKRLEKDMSAAAPVKAHTLRQETKASLLQKLDDYKQELASLRVAQGSNGAPSKLAKM